MWYYLPEWLKWFKGKPQPSPQDEALSEIIRRKAEEQKSVIDREPVCATPTPSTPDTSKVAEKDFFE
jgi:hypothetical protein